MLPSVTKIMVTRITITHIDAFQPVTDNPVGLDAAYAQLQAFFSNNNIRNSITLFAKPVTASDRRIKWYTDINDQPITLSDLSETKQEEVRKILADKVCAILHVIEQLPQDNLDRKAVENALLFPGERSIFVMNGQPVITAWGHQPEGLLPSSATNYLHSVPPPQAEITDETQETPRRKLWWLWLFLLLLLLVAIFLWFKFCYCIPFAPAYACPAKIVGINITFPDVANARSNSMITSDIIRINGLPNKTPISLTGLNAPEYRICSKGSTPTSCDQSVRKDWSNLPGAINNNEFIQMRMRSSSEEEQTHSAHLKIRDTINQWDVTTEKLVHGICNDTQEQEFETIEKLKETKLCLSEKPAPSVFDTQSGWTWTCPPTSENGDTATCNAKRKEEEKSEFDQRVDQGGGQRGEVQVTLLWDSKNDLDVHVYCPRGTKIWYQSKMDCSGILDIDANANHPLTTSPVENVTWINEVPSGTYKVFVKHYANLGGPEPTSYRVRVRVHDKENIYKGTIRPGITKFIAKFIVP